jgi:hypothetical protein
LGRGGRALTTLDTGNEDGSGAPAALGRVEWREKSGISRDDFFFIKSPMCDTSELHSTLSLSAARGTVQDHRAHRHSLRR